MAVEPNLEKFFVELKKADFNPSTLQEDEETLQLLLWYFNAGRTQIVMEEFFDASKTPRKDAEQILTNLAKLYPLSTSLVMNFSATQNFWKVSIWRKKCAMKWLRFFQKLKAM